VKVYLPCKQWQCRCLESFWSLEFPRALNQVLWLFCHQWLVLQPWSIFVTTFRSYLIRWNRQNPFASDEYETIRAILSVDFHPIRFIIELPFFTWNDGMLSGVYDFLGIAPLISLSFLRPLGPMAYISWYRFLIRLWRPSYFIFFSLLFYLRKDCF